MLPRFYLVDRVESGTLDGAACGRQIWGASAFFFMARFRTDRLERRAGRLCGVTDWMGGPSLAKVFCPCAGLYGDGLHRWAHITGEPDSYFSQPAIVNNGKQTVRGYVTTNDAGCFEFRVTAYNNSLPIQWRPTKLSLRRKITPWQRWFHGRQSIRLLPWEAIRDLSVSGQDATEAAEYWLDRLSFNAPPWLVREHLKGYGAWERSELMNHRENLARLLWLWANDCKEDGTRLPLYLSR